MFSFDHICLCFDVHRINKVVLFDLNARLLITRQNADPAALLHPSQILFRLLHVCVDLVHALLDAVQLFCKTSSRKSAIVQVCDSNNITTLTHFTSRLCTKIDRSFY